MPLRSFRFCPKHPYKNPYRHEKPPRRAAFCLSTARPQPILWFLRQCLISRTALPEALFRVIGVGESDSLYGTAILKRRLQTLRYSDSRQVFTFPGKIDVGNAIGDGDALQARTADKRHVADLGYTVGYANARKTFALFKRPYADALHTVRYYNIAALAVYFSNTPFLITKSAGDAVLFPKPALPVS